MPAISVTGPLDAAWAGMRRRLFQPFDISKWFMLGFTAWLSTLGEQGGGSFNFPADTTEKIEAEEDIWGSAAAFFEEHLATILTIGIAILAIALILGIVLTWINARGKFMFVDNLAHDRALVAEPWRNYREEGNSLFLWSFGLGLLTLTFVALLSTPLVVQLINLDGGTPAFGALLGPIILTVLGVLLVALAVAVVQVLTYDCIVPVMMKRRVKVLEAWSLALPALRGAAGNITLYLLLRLAIGMAIGVALVAFGFLTCCCGFILLAIPYLNAVIILPITTFVRLYALEFVRQLGPDFDVLTQEPPPAPGGP